MNNINDNRDFAYNTKHEKLFIDGIGSGEFSEVLNSKYINYTNIKIDLLQKYFIALDKRKIWEDIDKYEILRYIKKKIKECNN